MEDSNSTPSPMSSAASSQDSLHRGVPFAQHHLNHASHVGNNPNNYFYHGPQGTIPNSAAAAAMAAAKKKGVKSTLGRIFGSKKEKNLKAVKLAGGSYVTGPMVNSPSGGFIPQGAAQGSHPAYSHGSVGGYGTLGSIASSHLGGGGVETDLPTSDSMGGGLGGLAGKGDFDRRKKKK